MGFIVQSAPTDLAINGVAFDLSYEDGHSRSLCGKVTVGR